MEDRIINIEIKLANQELLLEQLSTIIYEQYAKIDRLEHCLKTLEKSKIQEIGAHDVKPPHY